MSLLGSIFTSSYTHKAIFVSFPTSILPSQARVTSRIAFSLQSWALCIEVFRTQGPESRTGKMSSFKVSYLVLLLLTSSLTLCCKESHASRPHSQHRVSMNAATSNNVPLRNSMSRNHSHTVSLGAVNPTHRVTRRKSMTSSAINNAAAIAAAVNDGSEHLSESFHSNRRSLPSKNAGSDRTTEPMSIDRSVDFDGVGDAAVTDSRNNPDFTLDPVAVRGGSAIAEGLLPPPREGILTKARNRRASEGAPLSKSDGKRASGELRCEKCGKGYKHSSCLTKHLSVSSKSSSSLARYPHRLLSPFLPKLDSPWPLPAIHSNHLRGPFH